MQPASRSFLVAGFTNTRKRRWVQHPSDHAQNRLTAICIDKRGAGDAPMKPKVKRGPRNATTKNGAGRTPTTTRMPEVEA